MEQHQLEELVDKLSQRLDAVEAELQELRARSDADIPEDTLMAISAAVSQQYVSSVRKVSRAKRPPGLSVVMTPAAVRCSRAGSGKEMALR